MVKAQNVVIAINLKFLKTVAADVVLNTSNYEVKNAKMSGMSVR